MLVPQANAAASNTCWFCYTVAKTSKLRVSVFPAQFYLLTGLRFVGIELMRALCCVADRDKDVLATHGFARAQHEPSWTCALLSLD